MRTQDQSFVLHYIVVCLEAISKLPNSSFDHLDKLGIFNRLTTLNNTEGPISVCPAVRLKASFS
jgi:hypothetical protein